MEGLEEGFPANTHAVSLEIDADQTTGPHLTKISPRERPYGRAAPAAVPLQTNQTQSEE